MNVSWSVGAAALACLAMATVASDCRADTSAVNTGKGIAGGAILGAEMVLASEAAFGVKPAWAYLVGAAAGAGAGALGGYYIADAAGSKPTSFLLAGGIAFVIPTLLAVATATTFNPPEYYQKDISPEDELEEPEDEVAPDLDEPATSRLELPSVEVARAFSAAELQEFGVEQATEVHFSLLRGTF